MEPTAAALVAALAILILLRRPGVLSPVLAVEGWSRAPGTPGEEEEQLPETDRAPRSWLPVCVSALAAIRLALLVIFHA